MDAAALDRVFALYPSLRALRPETLAALAGCPLVTVEAGAVLFEDGSSCGGFPLVMDGRVKVVKSAATGRELPLYRVGAGESCVLTSSCLLGHTRYTARGVAETRTSLVPLPAPVFLAAMNESADFRGHVFALFAERLADMMALVESIAFQRLDKRLATLLLGRGRVIATTHQALADELGSVREIVTRLLHSFAEQGLVSLGRERIEILDPAGLRDVSGR